MKTKFKGILTLFLAFMAHITFAQEKTITGVVSDSNGPALGVAVVVKGTSTGTQTDFDGNYSIQANVGDVLEFSSLGYATQNLTVGSSNTINVTLQDDVEALGEVVVTAQGIKREKKALGYAVSTIKSDEVSGKPAGDVVKALTGKAPGVNIQQTSGLAGSGSNIIIRGYSSINGSNQPLFVVDGIPFNSNTNSTQGFDQGGNSASSRFLDIDPNNIAEISILKGLSATTLYGQAGRNGVVLITTKSGSTAGNTERFELSVQTSYFNSQITNLPDYQNEYGNGFYNSYSQAFSNWGPRFSARGQQGIAADGTVVHPYTRDDLAAVFPELQGARYEYKPYDSVGQFFSTGDIVTTSLSASGASEKLNYNLSFGHTSDEGFVPTSNYKRLTLSAGGSSQVTDKLRVNASMNFSSVDRIAPPTAVGFGSNPSGASLFANVLYTPRSVDLFGLPFENPVDFSSVYYRGGNDIQNPRWTLKNAFNEDDVNRFFTSITTTYDLFDWMNVSYRMTYDSYDQKLVTNNNKGGTQIVGGQLITNNVSSTVWDHTLSLNFDTSISDNWSFDANLGLNPRQERLEGDGVASSQQFVYGLLTHNNFEEHNGFSYGSLFNIIGAYANATLSYNNYLYFNVQARNDWYSSLSRDNRSIFYPSASVSFVPTDAIESLKGSETLNYLKIRLGYGSSAGFPNPYATVVGLSANTNVFLDDDGNPVNTLGISNRLANPNLKPELLSEFEAGVEAKLFRNRLTLDVSVYDKQSNDLIIQSKSLDPATGFTVTSDNIGKVTNKGLEVGFGLTPIKAKEQGDFEWNINGQYTINENLVVDNGGEEGSIEVFSGFGNLGNAAISGQAYGVIVGTSILRDDNGNFLVGNDGNYLVNNDLNVIGDPNADWRTTLINEFSYKGFSLQAQWEYTHGGDMLSITAVSLLSRGLTTDTAFDRGQTFILPGVLQNGEPNNIQIAATDVGFRNTGFFIREQAVYDATAIRLREVSLGYSFNRDFLEKTPFNSLSINFIGRNLFVKAVNFPEGLNFDPEVSSLGVGNGQGFDYLTGPTSKQYGFTLNATF